MNLLLKQAALLSAMLLISTAGLSQADDDYLNALDKASGSKKESNAATAPEDAQQSLIESSDRLDMESSLAQSFPEEFAVYRKFNNAKKNDVIRVYSSMAGKAEALRMMKVVNKIGLLMSDGGWEL